MREPDLQSFSTLELLRTHAAVLDELQRRGVVRSANNPIADYTEWLVASKLGLNLTGNSQASYDALDPLGIRYQIKGRRITRGQAAVNLSAIRNLLQGGFDWLTAVVYEPDFSVRLAVQIPHSLVCELATYRKHVNAHVLSLKPSVVHLAGVFDLTPTLRA